VRGKEDPYAKIGTVNDRTQASVKGEYVKALDNINFEVKKGEVLGIIGKNGAGKSTLLKIISQITAPTTGSVKAKGRVASLLEVGTGMHPEMTGRENVYLNGTILGMKKREIDLKFDEIMDFAGCAKYADTPVKRYSSGMKVRLGFAVAAFLEPEILIVDEVLAVGDAEFQKKAIGKMQDVSSGEGRTVLFVSHNMASIKTLCDIAILIECGRISSKGAAEDVINQYLQEYTISTSNGIDRLKLAQCSVEGFKFTGISVEGKNNRIFSGGPLTIKIEYESYKRIISPAVVIYFKDEYDTEIFRFSSFPISGFVIDNLFDKGCLTLKIREIPLVAGRYKLDVGFLRAQVEFYFRVKDILVIEVEKNDVYNSGFELDRSRGIIWTYHKWGHERTE